MTENDLVGEIPSEIGMLSNLQELELGKNELSGPIPSELAGLAALRKFERMSTSRWILNVAEYYLTENLFPCIQNYFFELQGP